MVHGMRQMRMEIISGVLYVFVYGYLVPLDPLDIGLRLWCLHDRLCRANLAVGASIENKVANMGVAFLVDADEVTSPLWFRLGHGAQLPGAS